MKKKVLLLTFFLTSMLIFNAHACTIEEGTEDNDVDSNKITSRYIEDTVSLNTYKGYYGVKGRQNQNSRSITLMIPNKNISKSKLYSTKIYYGDIKNETWARQYGDFLSCLRNDETLSNGVITSLKSEIAKYIIGNLPGLRDDLADEALEVYEFYGSSSDTISLACKIEDILLGNPLSISSTELSSKLINLASLPAYLLNLHYMENDFYSFDKK